MKLWVQYLIEYPEFLKTHYNILRRNNLFIDNEIIVCKEHKGIEYIQFRKLLDFGIKHAYTLKGDNINFRTDSKEEKE